MGATRCCHAKLEKHFYYAKDSQQKYETLSSTARFGFVIEEYKTTELEGVINKGLSDGHSVYYIIQSAGEDAIGCNSKTIHIAISTCNARFALQVLQKSAVQPLKKDKT